MSHQEGEPPSPAPGARRCAVPAIALVALCATVLAHGASLRNGFVWDDRYTVLANRALSSLGAFVRSLSADDWSSYGLHAHPVYRPLATFSMFLDRSLVGDRAAGYHLHNLLLHALAAALLGLLLRSRKVRPSVALALTALFAVHPLTTETAQWISARPDLLVSALCLGALLALDVRRPLLAVALAALACAAKETGLVVLATVAALLLVQPLQPRRLAALAAAAAVVPAFFAVRWLAHVPAGGLLANFQTKAALGAFFGRLAAVWTEALSMLVWPLPLNACRDIPPATWLRSTGGALLALAIACALFRSWRRRQEGPLAAVLLFFGSLALVPVYGGGLSERYLHLPLLAACLALGATLEALLTRVEARNARAPALVVAALGATALAAVPFDVLRSAQWRTELDLFASAAEADPSNLTALREYGSALYARGDARGALAQFEKAYALAPAPSLLNGLCAASLSVGKLSQALAACDRAVALLPGEPQPIYNRSLVLRALGRGEEAEAELRRLARLFPHYQSALRASSVDNSGRAPGSSATSSPP